jgi:hypothetical protein
LLDGRDVRAKRRTHEGVHSTYSGPPLKHKPLRGMIVSRIT